jgi:hypothetical protein
MRIGSDTILRNCGLLDLIAMLDGFRDRVIRTMIVAAALVAFGLWPLQAGATLVLSPDGITVYDTVNNISWLANADLAATNRFGLPLCTSATDPKACVNASGSMSYQSATAWVAAMNAAAYLGHTNWQLPTTPHVDSSCPFTGPHGESFGFNCMASALGSLYYSALGLKAPKTAVAIPNSTTGPFNNFQPYLYWSQTVVTQDGSGYGTFSFNTGFHGSNTKPNFLYALPMIAGKIAGTPPAAGTGLQVNPGGQTVYDPVMNVTWLANANLAATNTFGLPPCRDQGSPKICVNQDGAMNWDSADQFVTNMNTSAYLGQTTWQLPPMDPNCGASYNCASTGDPLGELFYDQLGLTAGTAAVTTPDIDVGPFKNMQPYLYWSCEAATIQDVCQSEGPASGFEDTFSFGNGFQGTDVLKNEFYMMVYYPGPPTVIPASYEGLWWAAPAGSESGWGINFAHQGDVIFATWFTYDANGKAWWLTMTANKTAEGVYSGQLIRTNGAPFSAYVPPATATVVGTGTLTFTSATTGTFAYTVNDGANVATQTKAIVLQTFGAVPTCVWGAQPDLTLATNYQDLWWASGGTESGWGVNLTQQGTTIFATWFTYDANHNPLWLSATLPQTASKTYSGTLLLTGGQAFSAVPFDPNKITRTPVGTATFTFANGNAGTFTYNVDLGDGVNKATQSKAITRQVFRAPGTVCQ